MNWQAHYNAIAYGWGYQFGQGWEDLVDEEHIPTSYQPQARDQYDLGCIEGYYLETYWEE